MALQLLQSCSITLLALLCFNCDVSHQSLITGHFQVSTPRARSSAEHIVRVVASHASDPTKNTLHHC